MILITVNLSFHVKFLDTSFCSLVQSQVDSFSKWNGNTEISAPFARPSYSSLVLNHVFFLSFRFKKKTLDHRFCDPFVWLGLTV